MRIVQLSLDLSAGVGLDVAGLAALAPTLRRLVLTVRGLQLTGLASLAELHRLRHLQLRIQRGFYTLPGDQVPIPCRFPQCHLDLDSHAGLAWRCFEAVRSLSAVHKLRMHPLSSGVIQADRLLSSPSPNS